MQRTHSLDRSADLDVKEEVAHIDEKAAPIEVDSSLAGIADELAWARSLTQEEFADEQKKLLRKVSILTVTSSYLRPHTEDS